MNILTVERVIAHEKAHPQQLYTSTSNGGVWKYNKYGAHFGFFVLSGMPADRVQDKNDNSEKAIYYYVPPFRGRFEFSCGQWNKLSSINTDGTVSWNWIPLTSNGVPVDATDEIAYLYEEINSIRAERDTLRITNTRLNTELTVLRRLSKTE